MHKETKSLLKWPEVSPFKSLSNDFPYTERKNKYALNTIKYHKILDYDDKLDKHQRTTAPNIRIIINTYFTNPFRVIIIKANVGYSVIYLIYIHYF
jgi:hypothetical protein